MQTCCGCKKEVLEDNNYGHFCSECIQEMSDGYRNQDALEAIFGNKE